LRSAHIIPDAETDIVGFVGSFPLVHTGDIITAGNNIAESVRVFNVWADINKKEKYDKVVINTHGSNGTLYSQDEAEIKVTKVSRETIMKLSSGELSLSGPQRIVYADPDLSQGDNNYPLIYWDNDAAWIKSFRGLSESMAEDGEIILNACNVASGEEGDILLRSISLITGRKVSAGIDYQHAFNDRIHGETHTATPGENGPVLKKHASEDIFYDTLYGPGGVVDDGMQAVDYIKQVFAGAEEK
jgi:hypothetical protein